MQRFNFYEFDGLRLIETIRRHKDNVIDFSTPERRVLSGIIKQINEHSDNAMYYQIRQCLSVRGNSEKNISAVPFDTFTDENALLPCLIYIDFSEVFPVEKYCSRLYGKKVNDPARDSHMKMTDAILASFFTDGFSLITQPDRAPVRYVPFEKSGSMARNSMMLFIDASLYETVEARIHLGLHFERADKIQISKLYSYTGLYLTEARRISESPQFLLNEETVIVLSDDITSNVKVNGGAITAKTAKKDTVNDQQIWTIVKTDMDDSSSLININNFDGEGLISPAFCAAVNNCLKEDYGIDGNATSLQIRMPFTKGMLHEVDFHSFIREFLNIDEEKYKNIYIRDAFGIDRALHKAQIILTQSMFKCFHWLKDEKITGTAVSDRMRFYFERFHRYSHALYIGMTDLSLSQAGTTRLNYQFLNTLALTDEEFDSIVSEQPVLDPETTDTFLISSDIRQSYKDDSLFDDTLYYGALHDDTDASDDPLFDDTDTHDDPLFDDTDPGDGALFDDTDPDGENNISHNGVPVWKIVAAHNPAFLKDPKVKGMLKGIKTSMIRDIGFGRLAVGGSVKFLSGDLAHLLSHIIGRIDTGKGPVTKDSITKAREELKRAGLRLTKFYAADSIKDNKSFSKRSKRLKLQSGQYYGILRSPHLSRCEQCSLRPYIPAGDSLYNRYFSHLTGILMIPHSSDVPQALGGADFDGDTVKIITDTRVNRAINDACYYPGEQHLRRLPVCIIPDSAPRKTKLQKGTVDYRTLRDTFSSRVGQISNLAIGLGRTEYADHDEDYHNDSANMKCESCTILVGLEIDAAKTGKHPYLDDFFSKGDEKDQYIRSLNDMKEVYRANNSSHSVEIKEKSASRGKNGKITPHRLSAAVKRAGSPKELMKAYFPDEDISGSCHGIDTLPFIFLKGLKEINSPAKKGKDRDSRGKKSKDTADTHEFSFMKDRKWRKQVSDEKKKSFLIDLIKSYNHINTISSRVYSTDKAMRSSNYIGCIGNILAIQYAGLYDRQAIIEFQERMHDDLAAQLDTYEKGIAALDRLVHSKEKEWQFCSSAAAKDSCLRNILGTDSKGGSRHNAVNDGLLNEETVKMLENFRSKGYYLLYFFIKEILVILRESQPELRIQNAEDDIAADPKRKKAPSDIWNSRDSLFFNRFREIYINALETKEAKNIWIRRISEICRHAMREEFGGSAREALMYAYSLRGRYDRSGSFFWNIFTADEILEHTEMFEENVK